MTPVGSVSSGSAAITDPVVKISTIWPACGVWKASGGSLARVRVVPSGLTRGDAVEEAGVVVAPDQGRLGAGGRRNLDPDKLVVGAEIAAGRGGIAGVARAGVLGEGHLQPGGGRQPHRRRIECQPLRGPVGDGLLAMPSRNPRRRSSRA